MNSSTSSSDIAASAGSPSSRAIHLRIFAFLTLGMALCLGTFWIGIMLNDVSGGTIMGRVVQARDALPRILDEPEDLVMVFGSSMVEAGFAARQFDRELRERGVTNVKSFNFGFGGLNPLFQDYLARRLREGFEERGRTLRLALIEFNPFQATVARRDGARPIEDTMISILVSPREIWEIFLEDPERGAQLFTIHYLRNDISAEATGSQFGRIFREPPERSLIPEDEEIAARRDEIGQILNDRFAEDYPDWDGSEWNYGWQGSGTIPEERSEDTRQLLAELYATLRTPRIMENNVLRRIACCDIVELHFDDELVAAFIRIVKEFQQFSDHLEVIMLPRNAAAISYPPEARARLDAVIERIEAETGVTLKNFQDIEEITPEMYSDETHLGRYSGEVVFTRFLAEHYAPLLRR